MALFKNLLGLSLAEELHATLNVLKVKISFTASDPKSFAIKQFENNENITILLLICLIFGNITPICVSGMTIFY